MRSTVNKKNMTYITAEDIEALLRNRFCSPAWAFIPQVRNQTGYSLQVRTADAIAMSLWPSRGLDLHGFEIKVYRNDWLKELKSPEKAERLAQFCDFWWIVAPKDMIKIEEVPKAWGLMIPHGKTTKVIKQAEQLKPIHPNKLFLAAILRRAQETITSEGKLKKVLEEAREEGRKEAEQSFNYERDQHKQLEQKILEFEKASGIHIGTYTWEVGRIGEVVKMVLEGAHLRERENLERLLITGEAIVSRIKESLKK